VPDTAKNLRSIGQLCVKAWILKNGRRSNFTLVNFMINRVSSVLPQTTLPHLTKLKRFVVCIKPALSGHLILVTLKTQPKLFSTGHRCKKSK